MDTMTITFDTALGRCGIRWSERGITRVLLPQPGGIRGQSIEEAPEPPAFVRGAIDGVTAVMAGEARDLGDIPLDLGRVDDFRRAVYTATRAIAPGTTRSYGEIAKATGYPEAARDIGLALARNPIPVIVPCHRVVAANGALTGFSAPGGLATKRRMLELEGAPVYGQQLLFG